MAARIQTTAAIVPMTIPAMAPPLKCDPCVTALDVVDAMGVIVEEEGWWVDFDGNTVNGPPALLLLWLNATVPVYPLTETQPYPIEPPGY